MAEALSKRTLDRLQSATAWSRAHAGEPGASQRNPFLFDPLERGGYSATSRVIREENDHLAIRNLPQED